MVAVSLGTDQRCRGVKRRRDHERAGEGGGGGSRGFVEGKQEEIRRCDVEGGGGGIGVTWGRVMWQELQTGL